MIILGLNAFGENPSACLIIDGVLTSFCHEERFTRLKGSFGLFPSHAVNWCLKSQDLHLQDVDRIAFSWGCQNYPGNMMLHLAKVKLNLIGKSPYIHKSSINEESNLWSVIEYLYQHSPSTIKREIRDYLRSFGHKGPIPKIEFVDHHISHAYQTYYQSPFKDAVILVADGSGEKNCVSGFSMQNGELRKIYGFDVPQSLGWFYGGFTAYLGFHANRDEGKLMGLAALGEHRKKDNPWLERLNKILSVTKEGFELDPFYFKFGGNEFHPRFTDHLVKYITSFNPNLIPIGTNEFIEKDGSLINKYLLDEYVDIAYAVQTRLEEVMLSLVRRLVGETNIKNLCLAGGVCMNCKTNGYIFDHAGIDNIFVHPASSDDGSSIGAGFYVAKNVSDNPRNILKHVQLGPSFNNDEVEKILKVCNLSYSKPDDICTQAAELLSQGKILGWFHGGAEMGARALGGRSIIACPEDSEMKEKVNKKVKFREVWRPYCPSMTSESKDDYIKQAIKTPFMIVAREATEELSKHAPATVHVDGTVRPQTVEKEVLPKWHHLLDSMKLYSGHPLLLNTSFNVRGEPIVCNSYDAIKCFFSSGLDALIIEDFLVLK